MLELLSGPSDILTPTGSVLTSTLASGAQYWFYSDALGLCGYDSTLGGYIVVQLDGQAYLRSDTSRANRYSPDLQRPGDYLVHASLFEDDLYEFDKHAGTFGDDVLLSGTTNFVFDIQARASDRYLNVSGASVRFKPLDNSGSWTTEATLTGTGTGTPTISLSRIPGVLVLAYLDGHIVYYDTINKVQVGGTANVGANNGCWYSPKNNIFVVLASNKIKVFANAVRPATLSNPVAVTTITKGRVSQVKVRLLGSNSEPCAGEIIEWEITAGSGSLAKEQSTTDADGWAFNEYLAPVSTTGSATVQASVQF